MGRSSEWALNIITRVFIRERKREISHRENREEGNVKMRAEAEVMRPQARSAGSHQQLEEPMEETLPRASGETVAQCY